MAAMFGPTSGRATPTRLDDVGVGAVREQRLDDAEVSPVGGFVECGARRLPAGSDQNIAFRSVMQKQSGSFCLAANTSKGESFFQQRGLDSLREHTLQNFNVAEPGRVPDVHLCSTLDQCLSSRRRHIQQGHGEDIR